MTEPSGVVVAEPPPSSTGAVVAAALIGTWAVGVTVVLQGLGWLADQVLIYYAGTPPWWIWLVAGLLNAALVAVPSALLAFVPRSAAVRATGLVWLAGALAVGLLGTLRAVPSSEPELYLLLLALVTASGAALLRRLPATRATAAVPAATTHPGHPDPAAAEVTRYGHPDPVPPPATRSVTKARSTRWPAIAGGLLMLLPWLWFGALGGVLESVLAVAAAAALGWLAGTVLDRWLWGPFSQQRLLGGLVAGVALLLMAAGAGASGAQLALMLVLPPLGFAAAALRRAGWLVGLAALGPLALVDSEEISLLLTSTRDIPFWTGAAAVCSLVLAVLLGLAYAFRPALPRWVAATAAAVLVIAGAGIYFGLGQPGLHGERLFVVLADQADLTGIPTDTGQAGRDARVTEVYRRLVAHAETSQTGLRAELDRLRLSYTPYYLVNAIEVAGGPEVRAWLSRRDDVDRVLTEQRLRPLPAAGSPLHGTAGLVPDDPEWNVTMVRADRVWDELGVTGEGIVVGSSDSGVDGSHPALGSGFRGADDSWLDPSNGTLTPTDRNGHGTHTLGSAVGRGGIGVAPGAQWTGCANLSRGLGNPARYLDCLQFMLAPYPPGGDPWRDGRPSRAPHVLTNSWACPPIEGCDEGVLRPATAALQAAGIYAVVAAGNAGPFCGTIQDPPSQYSDVLTVGAVDRDGELAVFSSRGPVPDASKPDLVAPGARVISALPGGAYGPLDGTSMAAPHLAGVVALMWSANPNLIGDLATTTQILRDTARPVPVDDPECGGGASLTGAGLVDAHAAVLAVSRT